ncbi:MAG: hypothetical protein Q9181_006937, partial [Wetmoreana brouardii]
PLKREMKVEYPIDNKKQVFSVVEKSALSEYKIALEARKSFAIKEKSEEIKYYLRCGVK